MLLLAADSPSTGTIIGVVTGVIIFIMFIITCCICRYHPKCPLYHRHHANHRQQSMRIFFFRKPKHVATTMRAQPVQLQPMPAATGWPNNQLPSTGFLHGQIEPPPPGYPHGQVPYGEPPYIQQTPMEPPPPYNPVDPHGQQPNAPLRITTL